MGERIEEKRERIKKEQDELCVCERERERDVIMLSLIK